MARGAGPVLTLRGSRAAVRGNAPDELEILDPAGEVIGTISVRLERDEATIDSVTIEAERRGFGYGGEAVRLTEAWARNNGVKRFRAAVDETNGLGVYFLLRLGYSPQGPSVGDGGRTALDFVRTPG